jgi:hypothetical protein
MVFVLVEVSTPPTGAVPVPSLTYATGAEAAEAAEALNTVWRASGMDRRVRVQRQEAPAAPEAPAQKAYVWAYPNRAPEGVCIDLRDTETYPNALIPLSGMDWRQREMCRNGTVPWFLEPWSTNPASPMWALHFPYPADKDHAKIAFTASEEHGLADRQTVMRPGAYLTKFYGDVLTPAQIQEWALAWATKFAPVTLQYATTADEIQAVYTTGPDSCMSHDAGSYVGRVHPTRAYAGPDLQVAYITDASRPTGRAVVWPDRKQYARIYGDYDRMKDALEREGYAPGDLCGARLAVLEADNGGYHLPYLDGERYASHVGDYIVIGAGDDLRCDSTDGVVNGGPEYSCCNCGDGLDEDDARHTDDGDVYCDSCYWEAFGHCEVCSNDVARDDMRDVSEVPNRASLGRSWRHADFVCAGCYDEAIRSCDSCGTDHIREDLTEAPNGQDYCGDCHGEHVGVCADCEGETMRDEMSDEDRCTDCQGNVDAAAIAAEAAEAAEAADEAQTALDLDPVTPEPAPTLCPYWVERWTGAEGAEIHATSLEDAKARYAERPGVVRYITMRDTFGGVAPSMDTLVATPMPARTGDYPPAHAAPEGYVWTRCSIGWTTTLAPRREGEAMPRTAWDVVV